MFWRTSGDSQQNPVRDERKATCRDDDVSGADDGWLDAIGVSDARFWRFARQAGVI